MTRACGRPELAEDERYANGRSRRIHSAALVQELEAAFSGFPFAEIRARLDGEDLVWAPVQTPAEVVGLGRAALKRAADYARERRVFGRPIGQNQGIAHPLARAWMGLEAASLMAFRAAALFDAGKPCGAEANAAKYLGGEAGFAACEAAVLTHGGMGYAKEYHVERYFREAMIARIAPVSREMICNFIAEQVLDLPKSY